MPKTIPTHTTGVPARRRAKEAGPDAKLIRLCCEYRRAVAAYNAGSDTADDEPDPLWLQINAMESQIDGLPARTMEGVLAKAQVAKALAEGPERWPDKVVRDFLALMKPAPMARTKRTSSPTA